MTANRPKFMQLSPMTRKAMSFSCRVWISRRRYSLRSAIRVSTSGCGRFQFSTEKAYRVRTWQPSRADVSTTSRTAAIPARWPATRGRLRIRAQRPLPSMMIAMCRGRRAKSICDSSSSSGDPLVMMSENLSAG